MYNNSSWIKSNNNNFDVPLGAYNSAQIVDLVGIYILNTLSRIISYNQVGLYRDDRLIVIPNNNGPLSFKLQKKIIKIFQFLGFNINISSNLKIVNFLDVTFNLSNDIFKPFHKQNQTPIYIELPEINFKTNS